MWKNLMIILLVIAAICCVGSQPKEIPRKDSKEEKHKPIGVTSFDYESNPADGESVVSQPISSQAAEATTTQNPLSSYWNKLIQGIRQSIRSSWNRGNPLSSFLNGGATSLIESPVVNWKPSKYFKNENNSNGKHKQRVAVTYRGKVQPLQRDIYFYNPYTGQFYVVVEFVGTPTTFIAHQHPTESDSSQPKETEKKKKTPEVNRFDDSVAVVEQFEGDDVWRKLSLKEEKRMRVLKKTLNQTRM